MIDTTPDELNTTADLVPLVRKIAAEKIKSGWTQGTSARNAKGHRCDPILKEAACWCLVGGIQVGLHMTEIRHDLSSKNSLNLSILTRAEIIKTLKRFYKDPKNEAPEDVGGLIYDLALFNDAKERTQQQVVDLLLDM